ncbi:hypothetical protein KQ306_07615 [Synechococcus sp. CS-1324]|uniref:hypothetical protein n=1 Tax=Synechococcus sp. CS-1324 TaxID=2847980 RepID=UPI00223BB02C|nr:hypothetical protein [Synechococcus sp. CS-1324]MCT0230717.1 hypothetical protein [Synechococcus sp. CS-1324]
MASEGESLDRFEALKDATARFLELHWPSGVGEAAPCWVTLWSLRSPGPIPNHDKQGCYTIFEHREIVSIGLAASTGAGRGIGSRLYKHVLCIDWEGSDYSIRYSKPEERWLSALHGTMLAFVEKFYYLAPALDVYLIRHFSSLPSLPNKVSLSTPNQSFMPMPNFGAA